MSGNSQTIRIDGLEEKKQVANDQEPRVITAVPSGYLLQFAMVKPWP